MDESQREGERQERSFGAFDPVAGMRVVADIQAEGLRAAGALLERMLGSEPAPSNGERAAAPKDDYVGMVEAWTELTRRFIEGFAQPGHPGAMTVSLEADGVGHQVRLAREPGNPEVVKTEVWLHNGTDTEVGPLLFRCGELIDSEGIELAGAEVRFTPSEMEPLPARSSRAVSVSLVTTGAPRPGMYRGTVQAQGAPGLWLPIEIAIEPC